jgi:hypothetical protein
METNIDAPVVDAIALVASSRFGGYVNRFSCQVLEHSCHIHSGGFGDGTVMLAPQEPVHSTNWKHQPSHLRLLGTRHKVGGCFFCLFDFKFTPKKRTHNAI